MSRYEKMAYTIAFRILENREEAEEAVQDAFVKMYRALSDFHFDSKFSTWFYRIVYRTALTALRQQRMFVSYEEAGPVDLSNDEVESATALLEREDRKEMIARTLKKSFRLMRPCCLLFIIWRNARWKRSVRSLN